ncbi:hypothetical protein XENOCAPTIV_012663 [Xenoophorus captivus]|uniref:Uncharacterized protein n=1 Tax=Xenoophorus captivus TaxID=1517983 RepID=A0ABV0RRT2_9TELE
MWQEVENFKGAEYFRKVLYILPSFIREGNTPAPPMGRPPLFECEWDIVCHKLIWCRQRRCSLCGILRTECFSENITCLFAPNVPLTITRENRSLFIKDS